MKRIGITLVDLLVLIAIITLLMGVLMPAGAGVRQRAYRMVCGTNLSGIGKAMLTYSDDNQEQYPKAGWPSATWNREGELLGWADQSGRHWGKPSASSVTITSSFYLLIRYADVTPHQFVCRGDLGTRFFKLSDVKPGILHPDVNDVRQFWDFGEKDDLKTHFVAGQYCSYSYHMPYYNQAREPGFPVSPESNPASPLCGDRNPYLDKNARPYLEGKDCLGTQDEDAPTWHPDDYYYDPDKTGNSACHRREGQNILFNDGHVLFAEYPNVGLNNDNVWKNWESTDAPATPEQWQVYPTPYCNMLDGPGQQAPMGKRDAFLVSEMNKEP